MAQEEKENGNGKSRLKGKEYLKELRKLQTELCDLQEWVKEKGLRVIIVFEGRDAAGKGGTIKAITERVSPRVFRLVALPAPSDREKSQLYIQRYIPHFPGRRRSGHLRSQLVQPRRRGIRHGLLHQGAAPSFSGALPGGGEVHRGRRRSADQILAGSRKKEQARRFEARIKDPMRQWKLSPMDIESWTRWYDYSRARDMMLEATDTKYAPWYIVRSDDKRRARLNCISQILNLIPYKKVARAKVRLPKQSEKGHYDDQATLKGRKFVPEKY